MGANSLIWTHNSILRLVAEYKKRPQLWDSKHDLYRVLAAKHECWRSMARTINHSVVELKQKMQSLFASHRREKLKVRRGKRSNWFMYDHLSFLPSHVPNIPLKGLEEGKSAEECEEEYEEATQDSEKESSNDETQDNDDGDSDRTFFEELPIKTEPVDKKTIIRKRIRNAAKPCPRPSKYSHRKNRRKINSMSQLEKKMDQRFPELSRLVRNPDSSRGKDEFDSFGEYIAVSLRKHDERTQAMVKQAINNILFEQEMKKYNGQCTIVIPGELEENPLLLEG